MEAYSYCFHNPTTQINIVGMVFGVLCRDNMYRRHTLKLFDARNSSAGPFQDIFPDYKLIESAAIKAAKIAANLSASGGENTNSSVADGGIQQMVKKTLQTQWTSFEFSSDGNHLLLNSQADQMLVLDGEKSYYIWVKVILLVLLCMYGVVYHNHM